MTRKTLSIIACFFMCTALLAIPALALAAEEEQGLWTKPAEEPSELFWVLIEEARWGEAEAQYAVGMMYLSGDGVEKDEKEAASWIGKAADQGHPYATFKMGELYDKGIGVAKDEGKAAGYYRQSAEMGIGASADDKAYYDRLRQANIDSMKYRQQQEAAEEERRYQDQVRREQNRHKERQMKEYTRYDYGYHGRSRSYYNRRRYY